MAHRAEEDQIGSAHLTEKHDKQLWEEDHHAENAGSAQNEEISPHVWVFLCYSV